MTEYRLQREGGLDLTFDGDLLIVRSSKGPDEEKERWRELAVYRSNTGKYIIHDIGHTVNNWERTRYTTHVCESPADIIPALQRRNKQGKYYFSDFVLDLFEELEALIPEFSTLTTEKI